MFDKTESTSNINKEKGLDNEDSKVVFEGDPSNHGLTPLPTALLSRALGGCPAYTLENAHSAIIWIL